MTAMNLDLFALKYSIRQVAQLNKPRVFKIPELVLPKGAILHYIPQEGDTSAGPDPKDLLFKDIKRVIPVYHVKQLNHTQGNPRIMPGQPEALIRDFHVKNRQFRKALEIEQGVRDPLVPFVINYALAGRRYKYINNAYMLSNKWSNFTNTLIDEINEIGDKVPNPQFVFIDFPSVLPSLSLLRQASKTMNLSILKQFNSGQAMMINEFWKWLGTDRESSMLDRIKPEHYSKVNFIFRDSNCWCYINMAVLNKWRKATAEEREANPEAPKKGFEPKKYQVLFIRLLLNFLLVRNGGPDALDSLEVLDEQQAAVDAGTEVKVAGPNENKKVGNSDRDKDAVESVLPKEKSTAPVVAEVGNKESSIDKAKVIEEVEPEKTDTVKVDNTTDEFLIDSFDEKEFEANLVKDMEALEQINNNRIMRAKTADGYTALKADDNEAPEDKVMAAANALADEGFLSAAEYRRFESLGKAYKEIVYPGTDKKLGDMLEITPEEVTLEAPKEFKDNRTVLDKGMLTSTLSKFDSQYMEKVYDKDLAKMIVSVQNAGICLTGLEKERIVDATGSYDMLKMKIQPVEGAASTVWMKLPVIEKDGCFTANGVKYAMRKQRFDLPIRKIAADKVALTSYYGKNTVQRSVKKITDYGEYIRNTIMAKGLDPNDQTVLDLQPGNSFNSKIKAPRLYTLLSVRFKSFKLGGFDWYLDWEERSTRFSAEDYKEWERDGYILIGAKPQGTKKPELLVMDSKSYLYSVKDVDGITQLSPLPSIEEMLGLDRLKSPIDIVSLKVLGKMIPVGFILAYHLGLEKFINSLGIDYRRVPKDSKLELASDEWRLAFGDESLVFSRDDRVASMLLAGMKDFHRELKQYSVYEFDRKDVYLNLLEAVGLSARYLREIELLFKMFVDPITKDILVEMNEPTSFTGLLMRSTEMLLDDEHPDEMDPAFMRIRGFERIPGAIYTEMVRAIRNQNSRIAKSKATVDVNPYAIWRSITTDPAVVVANEINPIQNLKETEAVTYGGNGGRSGTTMVKHTREYHVNDLGTMSEATVDSSDVGINVFLSANPNFTSVRGISRRLDKSKDGASSLLSTSSLLAPASDMDDQKRQNFINIQNSHTVACVDYQTLPVRTGEESVLANRVNDSFASIASEDGTVVSLTDDFIVVEYKSGKRETVAIGTQYGAAAGLTIPHVIVTSLKTGQKVKAGDVIAYNKGYFQEDRLSGGLTYKAGLLANVMTYETSLTDEDSSTISRRLSNRLSTNTTKVRDIVLSFDQSVSRLVKVGDDVESTDALCIIEDNTVGNTEIFDRDSLDTLKLLGSQTPLAKVKGVVEKIEVYYHGDLEDMTDSLRNLARAYNRKLAEMCKAKGIPAYTGAVDEGFRTDGNPVALDTLVIKIYITSSIGCGIGDKLVFGNQGKSVIGDVFDEPLVTENGTEIDAQFGRRSIYNRIIMSPDLIGTTTSLLEVIGKKAFELYSK